MHVPRYILGHTCMVQQQYRVADKASPKYDAPCHAPCHAPMHPCHAPMPCTAQLARRPRHQSQPIVTWGISATRYCCCTLAEMTGTYSTYMDPVSTPPAKVQIILYQMCDDVVTLIYITLGSMLQHFFIFLIDTM